MSDLNSIVPGPERTIVAKPRDSVSRASASLASASQANQARRQRGLMVGSLCLLLLALSIVLWRDRDFWFPDSPEEANTDQPVENSPAANAAPARQPIVKLAPTTKPLHKSAHAPLKTEAAITTPAPASTTPAPVVMTRTVLPPLEVEVVAGDSHRVIRPGSSSVHIDLQPDAPPQSTSEPATTADTENAATVTSNAAERVQMSADASAIVASPVKPSYPLLARQMKVQGSVILQALIGRDGIIQNLRVVSGPHILASAAQDAVRQWHFKPHLEGSEAVETQAKITVNFTISTN
jgi:TonB family protein